MKRGQTFKLKPLYFLGYCHREYHGRNLVCSESPLSPIWSVLNCSPNTTCLVQSFYQYISSPPLFGSLSPWEIQENISLSLTKHSYQISKSLGSLATPQFSSMPALLSGHDKPRAIDLIDEADCWRLGGITSVCNTHCSAMDIWVIVYLVIHLFNDLIL